MGLVPREDKAWDLGDPDFGLVPRDERYSPGDSVSSHFALGDSALGLVPRGEIDRELSDVILGLVPLGDNK